MAKGIDPEKKFEAVMEVLAKRESLSVIARRYGMSEQSLRNAKEQFLSGAKEALSSKREREQKNEVEKLKKQLIERDQVIGEYTIANRILKKSGRLLLTCELKKDIAAELEQNPCSRAVKVLNLLDIPVSSFYRKKSDEERRKRGRTIWICL